MNLKNNTSQILSVHEKIDQAFSEHLEKTQEFLRLPSISAEGLGLRETAEWLSSYIETLNGHVQLAGKPEAPIVWAKFDLGCPKTLLVYSMYDVQPVKGQIWSSPPFEAEIMNLAGIGPSIIARGACNSKGPLMSFLNVLNAINQIDALPVNLILIVEGEEEIGSPTIPDFFAQNKQHLKADAGFEPFWAEYGTDVNTPVLSLGSKGILEVELVCRGGNWGGPIDHPVHSSVGAWLSSPSWRLVRALETFIDENEAITIEGFYDEVLPPREEDEDLLIKLSKTFDETATLRSMGAKRFKYSLHGADLLRKYLFSPTLGLSRWNNGESDVIDSEVSVRLMIRLVPQMSSGNTIQKLQNHLAAQGFSDIEVHIISEYPCSRTSLKEDVVQCMIDTYRDFGVHPQIWPLLASSTPYYLFSDVLGIPYTWGGLGKAGRSHIADEYATVDGLKLFEKSIATFLYKFARS